MGRLDGLQVKDFDFKVKESNIVKQGDKEFFVFKGYASTFGNVDRVGDVVVKGAFEKTLLENPNPPLLFAHKRDEPLGVFDEIKEDAKGLYVEGRMPMSDSYVKERIVPQMQVGSIRKMSIGYSVKKWQYDEDKDIFYLLEIVLYEASLVTIPANDQADINPVKCLDLADVSYRWEKDSAKKRLESKDFTGDSDIFDVVDGEVKAVPRAIFSLRVKCLKGDSKETETVKAYYKKLGMLDLIEKDIFSLVELKNMAKSDLIYTLRYGKLSKEVAETLSGLLSSQDDGEPSEAVKAIQNIREQVKEI